jgi:hypothetical protein
MGYELHITRADEWSQNEGREITAEEWLEVVRRDPEFALDERNGEYFAVWTPTGGKDSGWIDWFDGNLASKHPDRRLLRKMLDVAKKLGAKVQGDDGELYESEEDLPIY